ncbi:MAG: hypothetical protein V7750_03765 [Sneathiella sp.]
MPKLLHLFAFSLFVILNGPAVSIAEDAQIEVTQKDCTRIEKHLARDDVTYKPSVDVHGKAVAPADLNESRIKLPDNFTIDLALPLRKDGGEEGQLKELLRESEVQVGVLDYNISSGKLKFNGQELSDPSLHAIAVKCREIYFNKDS